jgi:hypothetical protein
MRVAERQVRTKGEATKKNHTKASAPVCGVRGRQTKKQEKRTGREKLVLQRYYAGCSNVLFDANMQNTARACQDHIIPIYKILDSGLISR